SIGAVSPFVFSVAPHSAFPSIARWVFFESTISPIHSIKAYGANSSSIPHNGGRRGNPVLQFHMLPQLFRMGLTPFQAPADRCTATKEPEGDAYQHFYKVMSSLSAASIIRDQPEIMDQPFGSESSF